MCLLSCATVHWIVSHNEGVTRGVRLHANHCAQVEVDGKNLAKSDAYAAAQRDALERFSLPEARGMADEDPAKRLDDGRSL